MVFTERRGPRKGVSTLNTQGKLLRGPVEEVLIDIRGVEQIESGTQIERTLQLNRISGER